MLTMHKMTQAKLKPCSDNDIVLSLLNTAQVQTFCKVKDCQIQTLRQ